MLNVTDHTLLLGPAERADVIVDFSQVPAGSTLILYNDAPAPVPAFDPRYDYYTGDPDQSTTGGAPTTQPGYGPNTRTIMQFQVQPGTPAPPYDLATLQAQLPVAYAKSQPKPIVPETAYDAAFGTTTPGDTYARIQDTTLTWTGLTAPVPMQPKAIQELFDTDYGRMNATLGTELPNTSATIQVTIPLMYLDPPTEIIKPSQPGAKIGDPDDGTQIWKVTHNGVDTHAIHFHLFDVQVINRVGWDGAIRPPDPNELGWKDTVRMNPLEDAIVAMRPMMPRLPFKVPDSVRPLDPTRALGTTAQFTGVDPATGQPVTVTNVMCDFGWEHVWHCHLLGHEENDMMRPIVFLASPAGPSDLAGTETVSPTAVSLTWTNNATYPAATEVTIQRATNTAFTQGVTTFTTGPAARGLRRHVRRREHDLLLPGARGERSRLFAVVERRQGEGGTAAGPADEPDRPGRPHQSDPGEGGRVLDGGRDVPRHRVHRPGGDERRLHHGPEDRDGLRCHQGAFLHGAAAAYEVLRPGAGDQCSP